MSRKEIKETENIGKLIGVSPVVHREWYKFCDHMKKWYWSEYSEVKIVKNEFIETGKMLRDFDSSKMVGYEAMERVENYANKNKTVRLVRCDDSTHATAYLILVPHPEMGITVIFIPQCTTKQSEFFLYPSNINNLVTAISELKEFIKSGDENE